MGRMIRPLIAAITVGTVLAAVAQAGDFPDPQYSTVPNVVYSPQGSIDYEVVVASSAGPIQGVVVTVKFTAEAMGLICMCSGGGDTYHAVSDINGVAKFNIAAGGCLDPSQLSAPPAEVYANGGLLLGQVGATGADVVDNTGLFPWQGWNPGGTCDAGVGDAVVHTGPIKSGAYSFCTDVNSNGSIDLGDAVILTPAIKNGEVCSQ
jgi:hypothetical protein